LVTFFALPLQALLVAQGLGINFPDRDHIQSRNQGWADNRVILVVQADDDVGYQFFIVDFLAGERHLVSKSARLAHILGDGVVAFFMVVREMRMLMLEACIPRCICLR
jgi:hypothetical protein